MIDKQKVSSILDEWIKTRDSYFPVDVTVSQDNVIVIEIDNRDGVWIDDCADLSRFIEDRLDRDVEDYELEVGSAGIGQPFKVLQQYVNHIGQEVEVLPKTGSKLKGILLRADENGFAIMTQQKQLQPGSKRAHMADVELEFAHSQVKYVKYVISLK